MRLRVCSDEGARQDPGQPGFDPLRANTWSAGSGTSDPLLTAVAAEAACALHTRSAGNGSSSTYPTVCSHGIADDQGAQRMKAAGEVVA